MAQVLLALSIAFGALTTGLATGANTATPSSNTGTPPPVAVVPVDTVMPHP
jgi:hypothetical protein